MSKLMLVLGIILAAIGLALGVMAFSNPAQLQVWGITPETAAIMLTGGILAMGLGGVIAALQTGGVPAIEEEVVAEAAPAAIIEAPAPVVVAEAAPAPVVDVPPVEAPKVSKFKFGFGRKAAEAGAVVAGVEAVEAAPASKSVAETLEALEQAKAELKAAVGGTEPVVETVVAEAPEVVDEIVEADVPELPVDGELYVVEEQTVRGHAARVLSDGTVEAETSEGWMRFENMEHLNEYLDATENA